MNVLKICGAVLIFLVFAIIFPRSKENLSVAVGIAMCLLILLTGIENIAPLFDYAEELSNGGTLLGKYSPYLLKSLGIGLICSAVSGICRENGESSVAACVEFFGKGEILVCALPLFRELMKLALEVGSQ